MENVVLELDIPRKCMLLERVGLIFDAIPMASPVERLMVIGRGIATATKTNENIRTLIQEQNYIDALKGAAQFRVTGVAVLPAALKASFEPPVPAARQSAHV
jgi:hypothetical protein